MNAWNGNVSLRNVQCEKWKPFGDIVKKFGDNKFQIHGQNNEMYSQIDLVLFTSFASNFQGKKAAGCKHLKLKSRSYLSAEMSDVALFIHRMFK